MGALVFIGHAMAEDIIRLFPDDRHIVVFSMYHVLFDVFMHSSGPKVFEHDSIFVRKIGQNEAKRMLAAAYGG